jgi:hypothetical protein
MIEPVQTLGGEGVPADVSRRPLRRPGTRPNGRRAKIMSSVCQATVILAKILSFL